MATRIDLSRLERQLDVLSAALEKMNNDEIKKVLRELHRPGWTTPAEFIFTLGITDAMISHVKTLQSLSGTLLRGSSAVSAKEE